MKTFFTWAFGIALGAIIAYAIIAFVALAGVAIFAPSPTAPSGQENPAPAANPQLCPDWFFSADYWRGLAGGDMHAYDLVSPSFWRGRGDAMGPSSSTSTCRAGYHAAAHGGCCQDGWHESPADTNKCLPDGH
jgi:hypothetical protein